MPAGLCHRCEYRAQFKEQGHAPRYECSTVWAVHSCYMYRPMKPLFTRRADYETKLHGRRRPVAGPAMLSARCCGYDNPKLKLIGIPEKGGVQLLWVPISAHSNKAVCINKGAK